MGAVLVIGRLTLRPLFRGVARTRNPEFFMAACLLVVLATGMVTAAAGLSMAVGSLIAGLLLAETEYRRQIDVTIEPFKGLLLGVFLVSVGMSLDLARVAAAPVFVLSAAASLVLAKALIVTVVGRMFGLAWITGLRAGLLLGPGGEFSLVVISVAVAGGLMGDEASDYAIVLAAMTMAVIPMLSQLSEALFGRRERAGHAAPTLPHPEAGAPLRVLIAGFGRVGQTVAGMLEAHRVPYIALDSDPDLVIRQRARGRPVFYGDMTRPEMLHQLDLDAARAVVVTLNDREVADALVVAIRRERSELLIVARALDAEHAAHLYGAGP